MKHLFVALALMFTSASPANAHPGHEGFDGASPRQFATSSAQGVIDTMIARNILEPSWRNIEPDSVAFRERQGAMEWVVVFRNEAVRDRTHRVLYVMVTSSGEYIAANYTGN